MATQLFLLSTALNIPFSGTDHLNLRGSAVGWQTATLSTARATPVSQSQATATVTGATAGVEVTLTSVPLEFISLPLAADVTIAGTVTANIWGRESNASANVAINVVIEVIRANALGTRNSNTLVEIGRSARTTEMAVSTTTNSVNNFTLTPTSTAVKRGDRLRVRVYGDDAGTMASGFTFQIGLDGPTAAADGDTYVTFTETFTFESTAPSGSQLFLTDTASDVATASVDREAWTSRGAGVVNDVTNTTAGWAVPIQVTDTAGGTVVDWFTRPLTAFTLGGLATANLRSLASTTGSNTAVRCEIARVDNDGTNAVIWGSWNGLAVHLAFETAKAVNISGSDMAVSNGQRLRIRVYLDDTSLAMVTAKTVTLFYAGAAGATGDTYITLPQSVTEYTAPMIPIPVGFAVGRDY